MNKGPVYEKSYAFALDIIKLYQHLLASKEYVFSKQLLRSGTSIGANINEASAGQSKNDFIAKMSIASKEARETLYWLKLLHDSSLIEINIQKYIAQSEELVRLLTAIVKTSQTKLPTKH